MWQRPAGGAAEQAAERGVDSAVLPGVAAATEQQLQVAQQQDARTQRLGTPERRRQLRLRGRRRVGAHGDAVHLHTGNNRKGRLATEATHRKKREQSEREEEKKNGRRRRSQTEDEEEWKKKTNGKRISQTEDEEEKERKKKKGRRRM